MRLNNGVSNTDHVQEKGNGGGKNQNTRYSPSKGREQAYPLNTCCCPRPSAASVASFSIVCRPLSTETWAMPAPMSPAPRMASCLKGKDEMTFGINLN